MNEQALCCCGTVAIIGAGIFAWIVYQCTKPAPKPETSHKCCIMSPPDYELEEYDPEEMI